MVLFRLNQELIFLLGGLCSTIKGSNHCTLHSICRPTNGSHATWWFPSSMWVYNALTCRYGYKHLVSIAWIVTWPPQCTLNSRPHQKAPVRSPHFRQWRLRWPYVALHVITPSASCCRSLKFWLPCKQRQQGLLLCGLIWTPGSVVTSVQVISIVILVCYSLGAWCQCKDCKPPVILLRVIVVVNVNLKSTCWCQNTSCCN